MKKTLLKDGKIFDGTGRPWYNADLLIEGEKIADISKDIDEGEADEVIDCKGLAVAPGFWDLHTHDDWCIASENNADLLECRIKTGVTTVVGGNCGYSPHPVSDEYFEDLKGYTTFLDPGISYEWKDLEGYLDFLSEQGTIVNYATNVGQGAIRTAVMGLGAVSPADENQLESMKKYAEEEMEQGAFGISHGLLYPPGQFTSTDELVELAKVPSKYGGLVAFHLRNESALALEALQEAIRAGQEANCRVQIHHHEMFGQKYFWRMESSLKAMREARDLRNIDVSFDFIPYSGDNTTILGIFPSWALAGGVPKLMERLEDPDTVERMIEDAENYVPTWPPKKVFPHNVLKACIDSDGGYDNILISWVNSEKNKDLEGLTFKELGEKQDKYPLKAAFELAAEEKGAAMCIYFPGTATKEEGYRGEGKLKEIKHPFSSVESDAILGKERQSPAAWGTAPRALGRYAREMDVITMEEAVKKLTFNPAGVLHVDDRGAIFEGNFADITVFNPDTVIDRADWMEEKEPEGIEYTIVNGTIVLEKGNYHKDRLAGQIIKSTDYY